MATVNATGSGAVIVGVGATVAVGAMVAVGTGVLVGAGVGVSAWSPQAAVTKSIAPSIKGIIVFIKILSTDSTVIQFRLRSWFTQQAPHLIAINIYWIQINLCNLNNF
jgi:hypothetical protein